MAVNQKIKKSKVSLYPGTYGQVSGRWKRDIPGVQHHDRAYELQGWPISGKVNLNPSIKI
jgi:hypothetical protein